MRAELSAICTRVCEKSEGRRRAAVWRGAERKVGVRDVESRERTCRREAWRERERGGAFTRENRKRAHAISSSLNRGSNYAVAEREREGEGERARKKEGRTHAARKFFRGSGFCGPP